MHSALHNCRRDDWLKEASNERLARLAADDPEHYLPGDVAWIVNVVKSFTRWLASGLGNPRAPEPTSGYPVDARRKRTV